MIEPWVCIDCGARQSEQGTCRGCKRDDTLDMRDENVRILMSDVERRLEGRSDGRRRLVGVVVGMVTIGALWAVPGYWTLREAFALPLFVDQLTLMALVGFGVMTLLGKFVRPRFPYLAELETTPELATTTTT